MTILAQTVSSNSVKSYADLAKDFFLVLGGSLFLAIAAQIAIPFLPVPLTMQTFAVMMLSLALGKRKAVLSVAAYIAESMLGLPVLSQMSVAPLAIIGLRGGYIFGFMIQAYLAGALFEKSSELKFSSIAIALFLISVLQLSVGALWLGTFIGWNEALIAGFYPFIIGEAVKCLGVASFCQAKK